MYRKILMLHYPRMWCCNFRMKLSNHRLEIVSDATLDCYKEVQLLCSIHLLMTTHIHQNNLLLGDHDFQGNAVTEINRYRIQC